MRQWIALIALTCTVETLKTRDCNVACKYLGYNYGFYESKKCKCVDSKPYEELVEVERTNLGKTVKNPLKYE